MVTPNGIETMDMAQQPQAGLLETIQRSVEPNTVANKFGVDKSLLMDIGVYGGIGFIVGFLLKKYSEYFISLAVLLVGIIVLQQFNYLSFSFNSVKIHEALGLHNIPMSGDAYGNFFWEWVRSHPICASSFAGGFIIGLKVG